MAAPPKDLTRPLLALLPALLAFGPGCVGELGDDPKAADGGGSAAGPTTSGSGGGSSATGTSSTSSTTGGGGGAGGGGGGGEGGAGGSERITEVCARWKADRADLSEGAWSGSLAACNAGDIAASGRANALRLVNLYRFLADLPAVTTDATRDQKAQECALMMHANNTLSHTPPPSWTCYTADGAQAAGSSNISSTPGVTGVDLYMADPGNETTMGHRRWILSGSLGPIGLGSTSQRSCMWVLGGSGGQSPAWIAWPPPGVFPFGAVKASYASIDATGWTIQSSSINLNSATVTITDGGEDRPVKVTALLQGYGSTYAISIIPQGWTTQAGHTYSVSVNGVSAPFSYDVEVAACN